MSEARITVLVDNAAGGRGLWAEHGLSMGVQFKEKRILFDTGQSSEVLLHNMGILGWDVNDLDIAVLSHGHYDHTGGLPAVVGHREKPLAVYAHPRALEPKYASSNGQNGLRSIGIPWAAEGLVDRGVDFRVSRKPVAIGERIVLTGEVPSSTDFEPPPGVFWTERNGEIVPDFLLDDQALILRTDRGIAVVLGCSHAGVINTLKRATELTGADSVYAVMGGMHLGGSGETRIQLTIQALLDFDVKKVVPLHCTGFDAASEMKRRLGDRFLLGCVGFTLEL